VRRLLALAILCASATALARSDRDYPWTASEIWPRLVRFLRVDEHLKVTEKDESAGYVIFELTEGKRVFPGAAEMSRLPSGATRVIIRIENRPSYMEEGMLDRLEQKLHDELGPPPVPPEPPPAEPPASAPIISPRGQ
jgi:hypothetical protein